MKGFATTYGASRLDKGGSVKCAHGGPIMCNEGCYAETADGTPDDDDDSDMPSFSKGGMIDVKAIAKRIAEKRNPAPAPSEEVDEPMAMDEDELAEEPQEDRLAKKKRILQKILSSVHSKE